jgi:hypothetical protein
MTAYWEKVKVAVSLEMENDGCWTAVDGEVDDEDDGGYTALDLF